MHQRAHHVKRVFLVAFVLNLVIATLETTYGAVTHTLSMVANGIHSYVDAGSSMLGFFAMRVAAKPSDQNHHYGHQKYETMSALGISLFIILTGWEIANRAFERLYRPIDIDFHIGGVLIVLVSISVNLWVAFYEKKKGEELHSHALEADSVHTMADVWVSVGVLLSLVFIYLKMPFFDTILSITIAFYFLYTAIKIIRKNVLVLTDAAFIDVSKVKKIVLKETEVIDCHHVRTRGTVGSAFVDMHIQIPPEMTTLASHRLVHRIEANIKSDIEGIHEVMIHTEPFPDDDEVFITDEIQPD